MSENIFMTPKMVSLLLDADYLYIDESFDVCITRNSFKHDVPEGDEKMYFYPPTPLLSEDIVYCDYEGYDNTKEKHLRDLEYLYNVQKTYQMKSKGHKSFKHNVNVLSNRLSGLYKGDFSFRNGKFEDILTIHKEWIKPDLSYEKNKSLMMTALYHHIDLFDRVDRRVFYLEGEPVGFVLYDTTPEYVHLFHIYTVPTVEYLQDYVSWMFFRYLAQNKETRPVNFGGVYGDGNIKKDKDRLCPYDIRNRWSWGD